MPHLSKKTISLIRHALSEDIGSGDITTSWLVHRSSRGAAYIEARASGIFAGFEAAKAVFKLVDPNLHVAAHVAEGKRIAKGKKVISIHGNLGSILKGERTALNFLRHLSGIATLTSRFVRSVRGMPVRIYDTRKTTPLWRELEKMAVRVGGGYNHRFGLWDQVLVKDTHWASIRPFTTGGALERKIKRMKKSYFVELEVFDLPSLRLALSLKPHAVLLDNFNAARLRKAVRYARESSTGVILEASGGVTLEKVRAIARSGVDRISVGAITHSAQPVDFSLKVMRARH